MLSYKTCHTFDPGREGRTNRSHAYDALIYMYDGATQRDSILGKGLTMPSQVPEVVDRILQNSPLYRSNGQPLSPTNQGGSVMVPQ